MARRRLTTHVWRSVTASQHRDGDHQARVRSASTRHECQCATEDEVASVLPSMLVIDSSAAAVVKWKARLRVGMAIPPADVGTRGF